MILFSSQAPLPAPRGDAYRGMAFDGYRYYLTHRRGSAITVLDRDLRPVRTTETRRPYGAICCDSRRGCLWAASDQSRSALFRLDRSLREIDRLELRAEPCRGQALTGVSLCCESGDLLVSRGSALLEADPEAGTARPLWEDRGCALVLAPVCLPPYILLGTLRGCGTHYLLLSRDGETLAQTQIPDTPAADALALDPRTCDVLALTARQGCYPYLLRWRLEQELLDALRPCCRVRGEDPAALAWDDALASVARVETAVTHLLDAEGAKLQAAVRESATPNELLAANASVQQALLCATGLEQALAAKLAAVEGLCGGTAPCGPK